MQQVPPQSTWRVLVGFMSLAVVVVAAAAGAHALGTSQSLDASQLEVSRRAGVPDWVQLRLHNDAALKCIVTVEADLFPNLAAAFVDEAGVAVHLQDEAGATIYEQRPKDLACLGPAAPAAHVAIVSSAKGTQSSIVDAINRKCGTHRTSTGSLSHIGLLRRELERAVWGQEVPPPEDATLGNSESLPAGYVPVSPHGSWRTGVDGPPTQCDTVEAADLTPAAFLSQFVARSRPVVIKHAVPSGSFQHWTNDMFGSMLGQEQVHVKVSDSGDFEGPEPLDLWSGDTHVPSFVYNNLVDPSLVLVRPAPMNMEMGEFLQHLHVAAACRAAGNNCTRTIPSFYIEYLSLESYLTELYEQVPTLPWASVLRGERRNFWFGDGRTVGKLHFDPFDNLLMMVAGTKQFTTMRPHRNEECYEGHLREGVLGYHPQSGTFSRSELSTSTSIVNAPVDMALYGKTSQMCTTAGRCAPVDWASKFPLFGRALNRTVTCTAEQGDVLYLPAFWWHEVKSSPDEQGRNIAINSWYDPFYTKPFPCATCGMSLNTKSYADVLQGLPL